MPLRTFSEDEVATHNTRSDLWISVGGNVYDLSKYLDLHPGGVSALLVSEIAGKDATEQFYALHRSDVLDKYQRYKIGEIQGSKPTLSHKELPYASPIGLSQGYPSPYYNESHKRFREACRQHVKEIYPEAQAREADGKFPSPETFTRLAELGITAMRLGPGKHLQGRRLMNGAVSPEEFDNFHELILYQEMACIHARGYSDGLGGGDIIGLPPVMKYGLSAIRDGVAEEVLSGRSHICLAVTEPFAGSDVLGVKCTAIKVQGGWFINGVKKWITNGMWAKYFTVLCRTPESEGGILLLAERDERTVTTKLIRTSYSPSAGTSLVTFDNCFVPEERVLGKAGDGFRIILANFNHERFVLIAVALGCQRAIVEECLKWAYQRKAFNKPLISNAVVRSRLAAMITRVEAAQSWLEMLTYQMKVNSAKQADELAGQLSFLKMWNSRNAQDTARDAVQLFGGRGTTSTGMGKHIEHYHRTLLIDAVGGGAEDVMTDFGVRQAFRKMPLDARL